MSMKYYLTAVLIYISLIIKMILSIFSFCFIYHLYVFFGEILFKFFVHFSVELSL